MQVKEVMTPVVETVQAGCTVSEAATRMASRDVGALPVLSGDDRLMGMLTDRDIVLRVLVPGHSAADVRVRDAMTRTVRYCFDDEECGHVARSMARLGVLRMPVLDHQRHLVGIVSAGDLQARAGATAANDVDGAGNRVDEAVEETFPASDPITPARDP